MQFMKLSRVLFKNTFSKYFLCKTLLSKQRVYIILTTLDSLQYILIQWNCSFIKQYGIITLETMIRNMDLLNVVSKPLLFGSANAELCAKYTFHVAQITLKLSNFHCFMFRILPFHFSVCPWLYRLQFLVFFLEFL